ncbi:MAG: zinc ribbon domain-containing protein [Candidatus Zixiibacteriota bacterium]
MDANSSIFNVYAKEISVFATMPTYDYKCRDCDHRFEAFQSMTEAPVSVCPHCGGNAVERLISAGGGLIFKGSGFYITDYRKDSYKKQASQEAPAKAKSDTARSEAAAPKAGSSAQPKTSAD